MIILQTVRNGDVEGILGGVFSPSQVEDQVTTFRNNSYIHRLNRTLQAEMRAVSAYGGIMDTGRDETFFDEARETHQKAGKELVRLIIANRGIPEEKTALSVGITGTFVRVSMKLPPATLFEKAARSTLTQMDRSLVHNYQKLLDEAPPRDLIQLRELLSRSESLVSRGRIFWSHKEPPHSR